MFGLHRQLVLFFWILLLRQQVTASYNDGLNPIKEDVAVWHPRNARVAIRNNNRLNCERPEMYTCEEPPDIVSPDLRKTCNYRNANYHEQVYRWVAGRGCLFYTPDFLFVGGVNTINLNAGCFYEHLYAPCIEMAKEDGTCGCYPFDPGLEEVATAVRAALIPAAHGRWERCFYAAMDCCSHYMNQDTNNAPNTCGVTFDGWTCWQAADAGTVATEICSEFAYSNDGPSCNHYSNKECFSNATWALQTDYSTCSISPRLLRRYRFHIAMLSFSIASCLPAIFVFFFYKRLRIVRVALHRNLLIAIVLRNILVIISRSEIYIDELTNSGDTVMSRHGIACRLLATAERVAANAVFVCMLVEGIYLHRLIVAVFRQKLKIRWLYGVGAVICITPVVAWATVMAIFNDHSCWLVYTVPNIQWILDAPRIAILLINTILFVDVLRVLLTKIRNSENANQLSTTKATLFLMPLFGTQFLLTAFRPGTSECTGEQIYYYVSYTVEGLQGFIVAMLYCYINKEVHVLIKATYKKTENAVVSRVRGNSIYPRMSVGPSLDRRMTYSTDLPSNAENKDQYAEITPKLHVAEIISIQATERLADILEPVYETIENGITNEGYDSLERSDLDTDSGFIPNRDSKVEDYYGFTNASSISIECQDWIRCISSPSSSVYNNSLPEYDSRCPGKHQNEKLTEVDENCRKNINQSNNDNKNSQINDNEENNNLPDRNSDINENECDYENNENMLDEILQYIETNDSKNIVLDPDVFSPNRRDEDKIIFVDE